jgi:ABC-type antimicrobial peptide transport system permease subunit
MVSGHYFGLLGLTPAQGRLIAPGDDRTVGESAVVVLSHEYWRRRFHQDPAVVGSVLVVNGQSMAIVGVAPEGFEGTTKGSKPKIFVPITMRGQMEPPFAAFDNRTNYWVYVFARLNPGTTIEQAATGINGPYTSILRDVEAPLQKGMSDESMKNFKAKLITTEIGDHGQSSFGEDAQAPLLILLAVTGTVLLIACANIANLLLVRGAGRAAEMAVRLSIGASRRQLIVQLLTESILLAVFGAVAGMFVATWTLNLTRAPRTVSPIIATRPSSPIAVSSTIGSSGPRSFTTTRPRRTPSMIAASLSSSAHTTVHGVPIWLSCGPGSNGASWSSLPPVPVIRCPWSSSSSHMARTWRPNTGM